MLPYAPQHRRHTGFSLVEIMVGMVIGLLGIIVIMQMYAVFEKQKRTTTSGDEAQNSGAIALYRLQRDLQHSGYGISVVDLLGCDVLLRAGVTLTAIAPVTINHASIPAGDANTDTLLVVYGNGNGSPQGDSIQSGSGTAYTMTNTPNALANDYVIAESLGLLGVVPRSNSPSTCSLILDRVVSVNTATKAVTMNTGGVSDGTLYNLGKSPRILAYAIRGGNLTACDYMLDNCGNAANTGNAKIWVPIASDVVSMRVQYGRDTTATMDGIVDTYDQTAPATNCALAKAPAVRIALVARGVVRGLQATTTAPTWAGSSGAPIVLTADTNWQRYHYKVFETTVPIRNVTWMGVQTGC